MKNGLIAKQIEVSPSAWNKLQQLPTKQGNPPGLTDFGVRIVVNFNLQGSQIIAVYADSNGHERREFRQ